MREWAAVLLLIAATSARADVVIGVEGPLSGQYQPMGQPMLAGAKAAVDAQNAKGGLAGETLSVITADDQCDTSKAEAAAQKLIAAHADVVIGPLCSLPALAAAKLYQAAGISMIAPTAALASLTESGVNNVVRVSPREDAHGAFGARRILAKRPDAKLALVDDGTAQMKEITASFANAYGKPLALTASLRPDTKDFAELVGKFKAANIDTLYVAAQATDAGRLIAQMQAAGLALKQYGPDTLLADAFWEAAGAAGENTLVSFPADPQNYSDAKHLAANMKALGENAEGPALTSYAAVQLYLAAAADSGPHAGLAIATALTSGETWNTVLGPMQFDAKGDPQEIRFTWFSWNGGSFQAIAAKTQ